MRSRLERSVLLPSLVRTAGHEHDWNIESFRGHRGRSLLVRVTDLPAFLVDLFPKSRKEAARIRGDYWDTPGIAAYAYVSEAFWSRAFQPTLASGDEVSIAKCFDALERMLECPDQTVRNAAGIHITPYLLGLPLEMVRKFAGPGHLDGPTTGRRAVIFRVLSLPKQQGGEVSGRDRRRCRADLRECLGVLLVGCLRASASWA
ncbi:hypothetical protein BWI15_28665 [Kribbella sp. ALI-6-A]|uniref:DUF7674 family protein n=1 Tax=Kribbella sp. ALI-6-A TaxID=1933817 RepID=UPI00097C0221|nr:hypothetical protein BWI15_28665 [Kribbella sp. ALI-6-A]